MRKYKLIKAYPNSTNEGTIVRQDDLGQYVSEKPLAILEKVEVEGYPSFWEEVKEEPNYLITAFRNKNIPTQIFYLQSKGGYNETASMGEMSLKSMLNGFASLEDGALEIYSVKNFKGEFTLEEKVKTDKDVFTISKFEIFGDGIIVRFKETWEHDGLELISKVKYPLYTTTDGVDIMEGDCKVIYITRKDLSIPDVNEVPIKWGKNDIYVADRYLTFTSEENRDKYIKENTKKPIFVSADNVEFYETGETIKLHGVWIGENDPISYNKFDKINHEHILKDSYPINTVNWLWFVDEKLAQEYIDNNKPKYSLKEIESCYPSPTNSPLFTTFIANLKKLGK